MQSHPKTISTPVKVHERTGVCDVRILQGASATEIYITATPEAGPPQLQAESLYRRVADVLRQSGCRIMQERLFASQDAQTTAMAARARAYGDLDDGVLPTRLAARGCPGQIVGVQVHAVRSETAPRVIVSGNAARARLLQLGTANWLIGSGFVGHNAADGPAQTRTAFELAEQTLMQAGAGMKDVVRTWIWMDDILGWYGPFNQVRTRFFTERGMMDAAGKMPASTGIGVSPADGYRCAIDVFAAWGQPDIARRFHAAGNQRSAYEYGSAFSRAAYARTPGGVTVFCSGTAAIDSAGRTCFVGDARGQIRMTIENVQAVLRDMQVGDADVVQALVYCVDRQVEEAFIADYGAELPWPCLTMLGDVCRPDLLFEVEVTACRGARKQ